MTIPVSSTNNFYKFFALSGVAMVLANGHWHISNLGELSRATTNGHEALNRVHSLTQWGAVIGALIAISGFAAWFFRIQIPADREARAKAELAIIEAEEAMCRRAESRLAGKR